MFFELTELLTCPRCGPTCGLVLLVQDVRERRVHSGWLGCPNCRHDFPVIEGVADLRLNRDASAIPIGPLEDEELAVKIAALSGLTEGRGYLMIGRRLAHVAAGVADLLPGLEVIAFGMTPKDSTERAGVSRVLSDSPFPLTPYRLQAAAIAPGRDRELVAAAARVVAPGGRLVLFDATDAANDELEESGLEIVAREESITVARRGIDPLLKRGSKDV